MERNLRRHKNKKHPKKPYSLEGVIKAFENQKIMMNYGLNLRKTERFYINTIQRESFAFTIFASFEKLSLMALKAIFLKKNETIQWMVHLT